MEKSSALLIRKLRKTARHYKKYDEKKPELMEDLLANCIEELIEIVHPEVLLSLKEAILLYYFKLWTNYVILFPDYDERRMALIKGISFYLRAPDTVQKELEQQKMLSRSNVVELF